MTYVQGVLCYSPEGNFAGYAQDNYPSYEFENHQSKITTTSPWVQWVNNSFWPSDTIWWQEIWVNIGSGNGLVPSGTKPLPERNVDWSSVKSSDIHIRAISQEMPQSPIIKIRSKITYPKFHSNFSGAIELRRCVLHCFRVHRGVCWLLSGADPFRVHPFLPDGCWRSLMASGATPSTAAEKEEWLWRYQGQFKVKAFISKG